MAGSDNMDAGRRKVIHEAMVRLADGERRALDVLLDELWPVIAAFVERGVGRSADAEDVAQEAFLKVCSTIVDFDRGRDGLSWAFGIARFEMMTHRKRVKRRREVVDEGMLERASDGGASQEEALVARERVLVLERSLGALTAEERDALGLVERREARGPSSPALRKRKQRALDRLRGVWRSIYGEP